MSKRKRRIGRTDEWVAKNRPKAKRFIERLHDSIATTVYLTGRQRYFIEEQTAIHGKSMTQYISDLIDEKMPKSFEENEI